MKRLTAFYAIACLVSWLLSALYEVSLALPILGLFGPAVAAVVVHARTGGRPAVTTLLSAVGGWRVGAGWYAFVVLVPFALSGAVWAAHAVIWHATPFALARLGPLDLVVAVLVVGEELGWRGFALPELLRDRSALSASLVLGVLWGLWHLPNFLIPGYPHWDLSLPAFVCATMAYSVLFTVLFNRTGGSVLLATMFHAAINLITPSGIPAEHRQWLVAAVWSAAAAVAVLLAGPDLGRRGRSTEPTADRSQ